MKIIIDVGFLRIPSKDSPFEDFFICLLKIVFILNFQGKGSMMTYWLLTKTGQEGEVGNSNKPPQSIEGEANAEQNEKDMPGIIHTYKQARIHTNT